MYDVHPFKVWAPMTGRSGKFEWVKREFEMMLKIGSFNLFDLLVTFNGRFCNLEIKKNLWKRVL